MKRNSLGLPECPSCGAWGKDVTPAPGALCGHCTRTRSGGATAAAQPQPLAGTKRSREDFEAGAPAAAAAAAAAPADIASLMASAEAGEVPQLDAAGVKRLVVGLEKKAAKNQLQRAKYADEPGRYLESEAELDEELKKLRVVAAAPEQYPALLAAGALTVIGSLLAHDNVDIATDAVVLLEELTDEDAVAKAGDEDEDEEEGSDLEAALGGFRAEGVALARAVAESCLDLVLAHATRLHGEMSGEEGSGSSDSAEEGLVHVLGLLTNLLAIIPGAVGRLLVCGQSSGSSSSGSVGTDALPLPRLLVALLQSRGSASPATLLAASEVLAMALQSDVAASAAWGAADFPGKATANGMEALLGLLNGYRRQEPAGAEEEETVANLFDAVCACLLDAGNRNRFVAAEGLELMLRFMAAAGFARYGALKTCSYALTSFPAAASAFVAAGGLKEAFPAFMGKGNAHTRKMHGADACALEEEHAANIVSALLQWLPGGWGGVPALGEDAPAEAALARLRVLQKFKENGGEKVDRLVELYHRCSASVAQAGADFDAAEGEEDEDDDEEARAARADRRYLACASSGLPTLQRVCFILASLVTEEARASSAVSASAKPAVAAAASALASEVAFSARRKLYEQGGSLLDVGDVLAEYSRRLTEEEAAAAGAAVGGGAVEGRAMYASLAAALVTAAGVAASA